MARELTCEERVISFLDLCNKLNIIPPKFIPMAKNKKLYDLFNGEFEESELINNPYKI